MLSLLISVAAFAAEPSYLPRDVQFAKPRTCRAVDYRSELPPARASGQSAYCFAYSSANLLTQRTGVDVSALDLATGFYLNKPAEFARRVSARVLAELGPEFLNRLPRETFRAGVDIDGKLAILPHLEGGFEASTLALANARGLCGDRQLPGEGGTDRYARVIATFRQSALHGRAPAGAEVEGISSRFRGPVADRFHTAWLRFAAKRCKSRPSPLDILPVDFGLAATSREFQVFRSEGRVGDDDQTRVLAALDYALDHGRVAAIGFDLNTVQSHAEYVDDDGDHSVAIVGRRREPGGSCQYLVRDSAGYPCADFSTAVRARCEGRHYWLTEGELRRSLYSVVYLR